MGAVHISIDSALVDVLKGSLSLDVFVETGTFKGNSINLIKDRFREIHSIELSSELHQQAQARFKGLKHINLIKGDSEKALLELEPKLRNKAVLYFLDAHWCNSELATEKPAKCSLVNELRAIGTLNEDSVIVIDDARLFISAPPLPHEISEWPNFSDLLDGLRDLSSQHALEVINDSIIFYPRAIENTVREFSQNNGIDWLSVLQQSRDFEKLSKDYENLSIYYGNLQTQLQELQALLVEKENEIKALKRICDEREQLIFEQARLSGEQNHITEKLKQDLERLQGRSRPLAALRSFLVVNFIKVYRRTIKTLFALGVLYQHPPRPLKVLDHNRWIAGANEEDLPTLSIVTPSYNQGKFIERTIKSVLDQEYPKLEYVVQDGSSSDDTPEILRRFESSLKHWASAKDEGQAQAVNIGFAHTSGEIMAYLNSDDLLLPGTLHAVGTYFAANPGVDVIYGNRVLINELDEEIGRWVLPSHSNGVLTWADYVPQETLFWRRSIWEKAGGKMDESFQFALDWDLLLRFRDAGATFRHLPLFLAAFRVHPEQKTSASIHDVGAEEIIRLRQRYLGRLPTGREINLAILPYLLRHMVAQKLYRLKEMFRR